MKRVMKGRIIKDQDKFAITKSVLLYFGLMPQR